MSPLPTSPRSAPDDLDRFLPSIAGGDADAFGAWLSFAEPAVRRALRPFAARIDAEAILQEALLRTWQVAPRCEQDGAPNSLLRLALTIAQNLARSEARRLRPDLAIDDELERRIEAASSQEPVTPDPLLRRVIELCRKKLPGKPAEALLARLTYFAEPDERLAERLRMNLNTFLQNFTRARKLLAECLKKQGVDLSEVLR